MAEMVNDLNGNMALICMLRALIDKACKNREMGEEGRVIKVLRAKKKCLRSKLL